MDVDVALRGCRTRGTWSLRALGRRAETSHATLAAYESGRVAPTTDTFARVVRAAGFEVEPSFVRALQDHVSREQELLEVLALAEQFPARHSSTLLCPVFGRT